MKKYELTNEVKEIGDIKLYRIKALKNFMDVKVGELGGWIEKESNLSHDSNAWVCGDAKVCGDAWVYGDALVSGNAWVSGNAKVSGNAWVSGNAKVCGDAWVCKREDMITIGSIGSRDDTITFFKSKDSKIKVTNCALAAIKDLNIHIAPSVNKKDVNLFFVILEFV